VYVLAVQYETSQRPIVLNVASREVCPSDKAGFLCDVGDCGLVFGTKRGLLIHKGKVYKFKYMQKTSLSRLSIKPVTKTTTEKLSSEVLAVLVDPSVIDNCKRKFCWTKDDEKRLNKLNTTSKLIEPRRDWTWGAADDTEQGQYNDKRMQLCVTTECQWKLLECN